MKLAECLQQRAYQQDEVIANIKARLTEHLMTLSSRGATSETFTFLTQDLSVRRTIRDWLVNQGFSLRDIESDRIIIDWAVTPKRDETFSSVYDRLTFSVNEAIRYGRPYAAFKGNPLDTEEEIEYGIEEFHHVFHANSFPATFFTESKEVIIFIKESLCTLQKP